MTVSGGEQPAGEHPRRTQAGPPSADPGTAARNRGQGVPRDLRGRARRVVTGYELPTVPITSTRRPSGLAAEVERSVLDLVLRTGEAFIATGAPVADTTAALYRLAAGFGVTTCQIDITFTSITVSIYREDDPITQVRIANVRTSDYSRLADLIELADDAGAGRIDLARAHQRLDEIVVAPHPYRRSLVTVALGVMAAGVAVLLDGGWLVAVVAAVTSVVIDRTLRFLRNKGLPFLFQQAVGAVIATLVATGFLWADNQFDWPSDLGLRPSLIVASSIVVMLAGLALVTAADDAISGFPVSAGARGFEVILFTVGIVVGIGFVLNSAQNLGIPLFIGPTTRTTTSPLILVLSGAVIAGAWGIASYARPKTVLIAMIAGALGVLVNALIRESDLGAATAAFGAAVAIGFLATAVADHVKETPIVVSTCAITPLLPGLAIYAAMFTLVESDNVASGGAQLILAMGIGLALAAGATLGEILGRPLGPAGDLWQRRIRRRARGTRI